jgi:HSP20 family protein
MKHCQPQTQRAMTRMKHIPHSGPIAPFSDLMSEFFGRDIGQFFGQDELRQRMPKVNIVERDDEFELHLLAPGSSKEDLKLTLENDVLTISAEKRAEELKENERYTRREFSYNAFSRSFRLPDTVDTEAIRADYVNGVLQVRIPKAAPAKPKTREIGIQ